MLQPEAVGGFTTSLLSCEDYDLYLRIVRTHDVFRHDRVVAEYRSHEDSMSVDAARMLRGVLAALASQWQYINGDPVQVRAYRTGIRNNRRSVRWPLLSYLRRSLEAGRWLQAGALLWGLARYFRVWMSAVRLDARLTLRLLFGRRSPESSGQLFGKPSSLARDDDAH